MKSIIAALMITLSLSAFAHEGHDQTPGALKAQHGGVLKTGKDFNMEMVIIGNNIEFFPRAHDGEVFEMKDLQMVVTASAPKGKPQPVTLQKGEKSFKGTVDFQKAYRLNLEAKTEYQKKSDLFKFLAEK
jgi:hypothetical protein